MRLICLDCGGYVYFEADVEGLRAVTVTPEGLIVEDAIYDDDWNYSDSSLRENLIDVVDFALKQSEQALHMDPETGQVFNNYLTCSRCGSRKVTPPYSKWHPPSDYQSLEQELLENRSEYKTLRKERVRANTLPVLFKP
ncbi:MAG: hypothetical protein ISR95_00275 [Candidatus Marinimicrobia bacterium]|nr:hypothetical protein [Candidatus Neomarinimicrobiota bacterium]MBL7046066.1 hypothetical protein [Candidatus Neomarinimicrobiota bacterium]